MRLLIVWVFIIVIILSVWIIEKLRSAVYCSEHYMTDQRGPSAQIKISILCLHLFGES